jgi:hypothetical protein
MISLACFEVKGSRREPAAKIRWPACGIAGIMSCGGLLQGLRLLARPLGFSAFGIAICLLCSLRVYIALV